MPVSVPIEIRFADIDKLQHVNNANYLTYFEQARMVYFSDVIGSSIDWSEQGIILARAEVDFLAPIYLESEIFVTVSIPRIGKKSFDFAYEIFIQNEKGKSLAARGKTVMVCYNYKNSETIAIPNDWVEKIKNREGL